MPVVNSLVFLFGSTGLAFQEVAIALLGPAGEGFASLRRFASRLGAVSAGSLALVAVTPALDVWLRWVSGLSRSLAQVAAPPVLILAVMPALSVLISFQRALLVASRDTGPVTWATVIEVTVIASGLALFTRSFGWVGATAAAAALVAGRVAAVSFLVPRSLGRAAKSDAKKEA
jgi:O-antigen/teichoic acid export membrane protein